MTHGLTRRNLLMAAGTAAVFADAKLVAAASSKRKAPTARGGRFDSGVMSGDPTHRGVTLWTRVGELERKLATVRLEVARDPDFKRIVKRELVPVSAQHDHCAKVRVTGLKPDERYWFRFATRDARSPVGRTQTAPAPDSARPVKFGFFSCQDYVSGHYGAYRKLLAEDLDFVVCLGDYIYERIFYPVVPGREDTLGANKDGDVKTLDEYRQKYRLYRSDPDLQAMHQQLPFLAMWDDHEVEDNYAGGDPNSDDYDAPRISAGWRAFHEYQPNLRFKEANRTYRRLRFGANAELLMLDSRSYRDDQPCGDAMFQPCDESAQPRDYLGRRQMDWLKNRLERSPAAWKLVGNQLMIMPFDVSPATPVVQDSWEGYQAERDELLGHVEAKGIEDVSFLTGDIHTFFAGRVLREGRSGPAVATEFVGGSTTSPGTSETVGETAGGLPPDVIRAVTDNAPLVNPWFDYAETRSHGVCTVAASPEKLDVTYWASRDVRTKDGAADVRRLQSFTVPRGTPDVQLT